MNWNEKYRPETLSKIMGQDHVVSRLKELIKRIHSGDDGDMPNLWFHGQAGTGKNCAVYAFLKDCFGDSWDSNLTELNASDERKIDTIRTKVKDAAKRARISTYFTPDGREKDMPFNVIFLDEVDALTPDAQGALRRIIEEYSHITRFIFSCNYGYKVIDPIKSRCMRFQFRRITKEAMENILRPIITSENIDITEPAVKELSIVAKGDARYGQNLLQNAMLSGSQITVSIVDEVADKFTGEVDFAIINNFLGVKCPTGDLDKEYRKQFDELWNHIEHIHDKGMDTREIIYAIVEVLKNRYKNNELIRKIIYGAGDALYRCSLDDNIIHVIRWLGEV